MKKRSFQKRPRRNILKEVLCKDQVIFKPGTSDQTIAKAFHNVVNLRISTAHSYNADFIVTNNPVKNALIKVYCYDKEQKHCSVTYADILVRQPYHNFSHYRS